MEIVRIATRNVFVGHQPTRKYIKKRSRMSYVEMKLKFKLKLIVVHKKKKRAQRNTFPGLFSFIFFLSTKRFN